jgi:hypothetical protein
MKLSFQLERADNSNLRGMVFNTLTHGYRPVTVIYDIAEGSYEDLTSWLAENYPDLNTVRLLDGTCEDADCLTLMEAAESAMAD